jgi:hypothetical protein
MIRWHLQRGSIVIPKTTHPDRMAENFAVFDFELTPDQMAQVSACNQDNRTSDDPDDADFLGGAGTPHAVTWPTHLSGQRCRRVTGSSKVSHPREISDGRNLRFRRLVGYHGSAPRAPTSAVLVE